MAYSIDAITDELMMATIQAANGITDNLKQIFEKIITK